MKSMTSAARAPRVVRAIRREGRLNVGGTPEGEVDLEIALEQEPADSDLADLVGEVVDHR